MPHVFEHRWLNMKNLSSSLHTVMWAMAWHWPFDLITYLILISCLSTRTTTVTWVTWHFCSNSAWSRDISVGPQLAHIGPTLDQSWTFKDQILRKKNYSGSLNILITDHTIPRLFFSNWDQSDMPGLEFHSLFHTAEMPYLGRKWAKLAWDR